MINVTFLLNLFPVCVYAFVKRFKKKESVTDQIN